MTGQGWSQTLYPQIPFLLFLHVASVCSFLLYQLLLWLRYEITVNISKGQSSFSCPTHTATTVFFLSPQANFFLSAALPVMACFENQYTKHSDDGFIMLTLFSLSNSASIIWWLVAHGTRESLGIAVCLVSRWTWSLFIKLWNQKCYIMSVTATMKHSDPLKVKGKREKYTLTFLKKTFCQQLSFDRLQTLNEKDHSQVVSNTSVVSWRAFWCR